VPSAALESTRGAEIPSNRLEASGRGKKGHDEHGDGDAESDRRSSNPPGHVRQPPFLELNRLSGRLPESRERALEEHQPARPRKQAAGQIGRVDLPRAARHPRPFPWPLSTAAENLTVFGVNPQR